MIQMTAFEKEIRKALIDRDMTVNQLARELGVSACYVTDIFKGNRPGNKQKIKMVEILELDQTILDSKEGA